MIVLFRPAVEDETGASLSFFRSGKEGRWADCGAKGKAPVSVRLNQSLLEGIAEACAVRDTWMDYRVGKGIKEERWGRGRRRMWLGEGSGGGGGGRRGGGGVAEEGGRKRRKRLPVSRPLE